MYTLYSIQYYLLYFIQVAVVQLAVIQGVPKKTGPAYVFSHPDYNFIPMMLKFYSPAQFMSNL